MWNGYTFVVNAEDVKEVGAMDVQHFFIISGSWLTLQLTVKNVADVSQQTTQKVLKLEMLTKFCIVVGLTSDNTGAQIGSDMNIMQA